MTKEKILHKLQFILAKDKFSPSEWEKQGLHPSPADICDLMATGINNCCSDLIELKTINESQKALKKSLKKGLTQINKRQLDTAEKEFICAYFSELATIVSVDINDELNRWIYGFFMNILIKTSKRMSK